MGLKNPTSSLKKRPLELGFTRSSCCDTLSVTQISVQKIFFKQVFPNCSPIQISMTLPPWQAVFPFLKTSRCCENSSQQPATKENSLAGLEKTFFLLHLKHRPAL